MIMKIVWAVALGKGKVGLVGSDGVVIGLSYRRSYSSQVRYASNP